MEALNEMLAEEPTSALIRQQLQNIHRRVTTLEKREQDRLNVEKFNQKLLYGVGGLSLLAIFAAISAKASNNSFY